MIALQAEPSKDALSELNVYIFFNFLKKKSLIFLNLVITLVFYGLHCSADFSPYGH